MGPVILPSRSTRSIGEPTNPAFDESPSLQDFDTAGELGTAGENPALGFARGPTLPFHSAGCVHVAFEQQVRKSPEAIAITWGQENWTYARLDFEANRLAATLRQEGVGPDVLVGIYLHRTPRLLAGILGILKAGGAYVPLDPAYPQERLQFIAEDTRMPLLVTERGLSQGLTVTAVRSICLDDVNPAVREGNLPRQNPTADNLAYVLYTSGSTGRPKGVCVPHRGVVALTAWAESLYSRDELSGVLFATSVCFDVSVFESLVPLCLGGRIVLVENLLAIGTPSSGANVTLASGVPSAMAEVVRAGLVPASVRTVNVAGEPCPQSLVDALYALGHVEKVYDVYGPTETTVYSIGGLRRPGGVASIGRPLPNEQAYVLDAALNPVAIGIRGELFIGGAKLARGYLHRPELTAEKFREVPGLPGERLYRTGDAARWRANGTLEFLGRLDRQVKIRGFRVEPGEIETALREYPGVRECAVVPRDDATGTQILVAYVAGPKSDADLEDLRGFLAGKLPVQLVPTSFISLDALPRSPNGKLDLQALPVFRPMTAPVSQRVAARDDLESRLVRIWEEVLGVAPIGIHDRFVDLGGHSLLAARLAAEVEKQFGRKLSLSVLFKAPTVELLARAIRNGTVEATASLVLEIQPLGDKPPLFWLHTLGGDGGGAGLFTYDKLARMLGPEQPSYGLIAPHGKPPVTLEEMAAGYIQEIRKVQPVGPYLVGGYCFGGVLAYEVARQLAAEGASIALVVLLDAAPVWVPGLPGPFSFASLAHVARSLPEWAAAAFGDLPDLRQRMGLWRNRLRKKARADRAAGGARLDDFLDMEKYPAEFKAYAEAHGRALLAYRPKPFSGRLALFRTHRPRLTMFPAERLWRLLGCEVEVKIVPGTHADLLNEPQVSLVARELSVILDRQQRHHEVVQEAG